MKQEKEMVGLFGCSSPDRRDGHRRGALEAEALEDRASAGSWGALVSLNSPPSQGTSSLKKA